MQTNPFPNVPAAPAASGPAAGGTDAGPRSSRRTFWLTLTAHQATWFVAVIGAGAGHWWPGVAAACLFAAWRLGRSEHRRLELRLIGLALLLGVGLENLWVSLGFLNYAAAWPTAGSPAWILALWAAFALTVLPVLRFMLGRPALAALLGAVGGPLAYWGASRGWGAVAFGEPAVAGLLALALGWAVAMPLLTTMAARGLREQAPQV